jgi:AcrR family transcriptional regulator
MRTNKLKRPKEPVASREEFIEAAAKLFDQKGYFKTSVDDIVRVAKRSKGGFYHHFKSKEALFRTLFEKMVDDRMASLLEKIKSGLTIREAMQIMLADLNTHSNYLMTKRQIKRAAELYLVALHDPNALSILKPFHRKVLGIFTEILEIGKQRKELTFSLPTPELSEMLYDANRGILLLDAILHRGEHALERLTKHLLYEISHLETKPARDRR